MDAYDEGWEDAYDNLVMFSEDSYSKNYNDYMRGYNDAMLNMENDYIEHEWLEVSDDYESSGGDFYNEDDVYIDYYE